MKPRRIAVRAIVFKDGELFCMKLKNYSGKATRMDFDYWCAPGGGVDDGESFVNALEREIFEETGVAPEIGELLYVQQFMHNAREHIEFFFHVTNTEAFSEIDLDSSTHGKVEVEEAGFIDPKNQTVLPTFLRTQNIAEDILQGKTKFFSYLS